MPERVVYNGTTLWTAGASPNVAFNREVDLTGRTHVIEELGDTSTNIYRGSKRNTRSYEITCDLIAGGAFTLAQLIAWWEETHSADGGLRVLLRETGTGVFYLDCVPEAPKWGSDNGPVWIEVVQTYTAPTPLWYGAETSANGNFNGGAPVTIVCNNAGNVASCVRLEIENEVDTPKVSLGTTWEIEFDLAMAGGDLLEVACKTPASAWYTPVGGAATRAYGYRTEATSFRKAKLQPGNNNVVISATAGNGLCTVYWKPLYEALT